ncbi:hypothetical protein CAOG_01444 [Capsaspora owczarzaki ATCC 30864]|uniref:GCF C-terminal domain-containing protein n=1 Tax=Capsaspora owczarzaki (strain ATCC 30864) TaxID=595528 RepID=A0A0D2X125_CAPO3|nr:hypothetical protein CAOG_01444 [Capsaspora owczarzaki ATCC 30864]KJE90069.1 hypothetical protein CAOG_001444 [Capsaspora owczarzaki ATCC 30864]|eukprot:XP_004364312.2 hypothetical protein CAOG_01444 [Capsaspora owczarzaki ATCC 30864]
MTMMMMRKPTRTRNIRQKLVGEDDDSDDANNAVPTSATEESGSLRQHENNDDEQSTGAKRSDDAGRPDRAGHARHRNRSEDKDGDKDDEDEDEDDGPASIAKTTSTLFKRSSTGLRIAAAGSSSGSGGGGGATANRAVGGMRAGTATAAGLMSSSHHPVAATTNAAAAKSLMSFADDPDAMSSDADEEEARVRRAAKESLRKSQHHHHHHHHHRHDHSDEPQSSQSTKSHERSHRSRGEDSVREEDAPAVQRSLADIKAAYGIVDTPNTRPPASMPMQIDEDNADDGVLTGEAALNLADTQVPEFEQPFDEDRIPDANRIAEAKLRRERARKTGDYISLSEGAGLQDSRASLPAADDPAIGEEGHYGEYSGNRISFGVKSKHAEKMERAKIIRQALNEGMDDDNDDDTMDTASARGRGDEDDEDDEVRAWERAQIQKGGAAHVLAQATKAQQKQQRQHDQAPSDRGILGFRQPPQHDYMPNIAALPLPLPFEVAQGSINERLTDLRDALTHYEHKMARVQAEQTQVKGVISKLTDEIDVVSARLSYFQGVKDYVTDLLGCLDAKWPLIQAAEGSLNELFQAFGSLTTDVSVDDDALEAPVHRSRYDEQLVSVLGAAQRIFDDVLDDFGSLEFVIGKFDELRRLYPQMYSESYVSFFLPNLFSPYVSHALLAWHPLLGDAADITAMPWFGTIAAFAGRSASSTGAGALDANPDADLLLQSIEKSLLPRMLGVLMHVWNPFSLCQSSRALSVVSTLIQLADKSYSSAITQTFHTCLRDSVVQRIQEALELRPGHVNFPSPQAKAALLTDLANPTSVLTDWISLLPNASRDVS